MFCFLSRIHLAIVVDRVGDVTNNASAHGVAKDMVFASKKPFDVIFLHEVAE